MGTFPTAPRAAFLAWAQTHAPVFVDNDSLIGLTEPQALSFQTAYNNAATAVQQQDAAISAAKAATTNANEKVGILRRSATLTTRMIRTFAENTNNPNVYAIAQIPPPADPGVAPPPAKPIDLSVELNNSSGALVLRWKASNPVGTSGTSYLVKRKLPTQSAFIFLGITGEKKFVDESFTAGPDSVQYIVQGHRAGSEGPESNVFTVNFGKAPGGGLTATVTDEGGGEQAMKLAA